MGMWSAKKFEQKRLIPLCPTSNSMIMRWWLRWAAIGFFIDALLIAIASLFVGDLNRPSHEYKCDCPVSTPVGDPDRFTALRCEIISM